jgi:hypothetical protein
VTDEATAANEVVLELNITMPSNLTTIANQAKAFWDENGDNVVNASDANVAGNTPVLTANASNVLSASTNATVFTRPVVATAPSLEQTGIRTMPALILTSGIVAVSSTLYIVKSKHKYSLRK